MMQNARRDKDRMVLADIFEAEVNYCGWQRQLPEALEQYLRRVVAQPLRLTQVLTIEDSREYLMRKLPEAEGRALLVEDIVELMDMFTCLLDCHQVGLRMTVLDKAMCPKFHRDNLPVRLVTTYIGNGTEWRYSLAANDQDYCTAETGEVILLKGEAWPNNEGHGVWHRSPEQQQGERRLVLTLDPM